MAGDPASRRRSASPLPRRASYAASESGEATPVCSHPPYAFGLYDLSGKSGVYCLDEWREGFRAHSSELDPITRGSPFPGDALLEAYARRVIRSGSWGGTPVNLRVAYRDSRLAGARVSVNLAGSGIAWSTVQGASFDEAAQEPGPGAEERTMGREDEPLVGVMGEDPRRTASIEIGRRACELIVDSMVRKARELIGQAK